MSPEAITVLIIVAVVVSAMMGAATLTIQALTLWAVGRHVWARTNRERAQRQLLHDGEHAMATVVSIHRGERRDNGGAYHCDLVLQVTPDEGLPYEAELNVLVDVVRLARVQPGSVVDVAFDPADPSRVAVYGVAPESFADIAARIRVERTRRSSPA